MRIWGKYPVPLPVDLLVRYVLYGYFEGDVWWVAW
jgi:hypothetical protein